MAYLAPLSTNTVNVATMLLQLPVEDIIKELLTTASQDRSQLHTILIWAVVILVINVLSVLWNTVLQIRLKDREKDIANYNMKQTKKLAVYESIFDKFNNMTLFMSYGDTAALTQSVQVLQTYINANKIYVDSSSVPIFNKHLDYFRRMIIAPYQKDVRYEAAMLDELVVNFNNI
ncbi:hypothetical protein [Hymenobacter convexus]|uniref:hypothetical protein n=1 Tax=Hymenobacter sp. CA1UV-4 TaxID=3063782 RepID=UPI0027126ADD|nr:hypothetical protein [Hymenobacter sp. CA1UV-4]MDO7853590.1 hypothetical protein [Hymenobacter sp. CA1UV-4]